MGEKIKKFLVEHGITQTFIAKSTGLTDQVISDICNKGRKIDCEEYFKICQALNVPLDYFFVEKAEEG